MTINPFFKKHGLIKTGIAATILIILAAIPFLAEYERPLKESKLPASAGSFIKSAFPEERISFAKIEIEAIKWIARIIIIIISALLAIESLQKIKIPKPLQKIILLLLAIAIGLTASPIYNTIVSTLLETNDISIIMNILIHIGYLVAYIIPYIIILLICHIPWKKLSEHGKQGVQISIMIATILVILFI